MDKKRIAVIGLKGLPAFGGAGAVGELVLNELENHFDFTVYADSANTHLKSGKYNGYKQIVFKSIKHQGINFLLYFLKSAIHCMFTKKYDIIHVHHLAGGFIVPILRLRHKNVIVTAHGLPQRIDKWAYISWLYYPIMSILFSRFSKVITTVSNLDSKYFKKYTSKKIVYIPNGIKRMNIPDNIENDYSDIFFAAGRIIATKGCHILMSSLIQIKFGGKLIIAGDINQIDSYKNKLIDLSKKLDVDFKGLIKDKQTLLNLIKNSKVFVFPSMVEAMSMMLLEVSSTKTPIIASDIPENKAIFSENEVLFFKTNDIDDLSKKITYALNNEKEMNIRAENAYNKLMGKYNINTIAMQYAQQYNDLL